MTQQNNMGRKIGVGAALVILPVGAGYVCWQVKGTLDARDRALEKGFTYDTTALRQIDPALIRYRQVGQINTAMSASTCMTLARDGRLIVGGAQMVRLFDAKGLPLGAIPISGTPQCLATGADGTLFVSMKDHVEVYDAQGKHKASWASLGDRAYITSMAVSGSDVWLADAGQRLVLRCTMDGKVEAELGKQDDSRGVPGLIVPSPHMDVAVTAEGLICVANPGRHQLELYSRDGELQRVWGKSGTSIETFCGCCNPANFALLADGSIVTAEKGLARVKIYTPDGHLDCVVAGPDVFGEAPRGLNLAVDSSNRILVLEPGTNTVRLFVRNDGAGSQAKG